MSRIELSPREQKVLESLARSTKTEYRLVQRAKIILLLSEGIRPTDIGRRLEINRPQVYLWEKRGNESFERRQSLLEREPSEKPLQHLIVEILADLARSGAPPDFGPEVITQLISLACEPVEKSGDPVSHWSPRELRQEMIKRKIVRDLSIRSVGRFLKGGGFKTSSNRVLADPEN